MKLGADLMYSTVQKIAKGDVEAIDQSAHDLTSIHPAPKIFKPDCKINFEQSVQVVHNFCRGLSPYPGAWCTIKNSSKDEVKTYKLFTTEKTTIPVSGSDIRSNENGILFPCSDYHLLVTEIQQEGKRKMNFTDFLAGNSLNDLILVD